MFKKVFLILFCCIFLVSPYTFANEPVSTGAVDGAAVDSTVGESSESVDEDSSESDENLVSEVVASSVEASKVPDINSRAAVVLDRKSHTVLFGKNELNRVKMASTTKIMTATVVLENCSLDEIVTVSAKAAGTGGSRVGLHTDDKVSVRDLLYGLLLFSGNDTATALAEHVGGSVDGFAELMNKKALELGLSNTCFKTPHGLDKEGHFTTAYELALLTDYAMKNETFANFVNTKVATININGKIKEVKNTNELLGNLNGVYGVKTGFTNGANRCLVSACKRGDLDVICVVLGADTKKFRTTDSVKLIEYTFANFTPTNISDIAVREFDSWKSENLDSFNVYKPSEYCSDLDLRLEDFGKISMPIKNDEIEQLEVKVDCVKDIIPPMKSGTVLGCVSVCSGDKVIFAKNILLENNLYSKSIWEYFMELWKDFSR